MKTRKLKKKAKLKINKLKKGITIKCSRRFYVLHQMAALMAPLAASRLISLAFPLPRKYMYTCCTIQQKCTDSFASETISIQRLYTYFYSNLEIGKET